MYRRRNLLLLLALTLALMSCSSGPPPAQKGTPPYYWQAAQETFAAGDYLRTNDHLSQLVRTENEFTARAYPWLLVLDCGIAKAYMDLGDAFEGGARQNKTSPAPFRKQMSDFRTKSNSVVLQFVEQFLKYAGSNKDEKIPLAFPFPTGNAMPVMELSKAGAGILLQEGEFANAQKRAIERAVLMAASRAVGAPENPAKAREVFKAASPAVPRATFLLAMANAIFEQSQIYGPRKMDHPDRLKMLLKHAGDTLAPLPESKEKADLAKKIQAAVKDSGK